MLLIRPMPSRPKLVVRPAGRGNLADAVDVVILISRGVVQAHFIADMLGEVALRVVSETAAARAVLHLAEFA